jgi:tRNA-2-methylthio-N6-dimethylallyladenosine synthase
LQTLQDEHTLAANVALEGSLQELLVEGRSKNSEKDLMGRTSSWKIVNFKSDDELTGKIVKVQITKAYLHSLRGKIVDD